MLDIETKAWADEIFQKIEEKMRWVSEKSKDKIPYQTVNGTYDDKSDQAKSWAESDGLNWWTNGFWGGLLWMLYHKTGKISYAKIARRAEEKMDPCFEQYYGLHHDVGFMWRPTAVADYQLTKNVESKKRALHAANLLAGRFNPVGRFIRAWNDSDENGPDTRGWAIIDCMMNLSLLYWASEETNDPRFRQIAMMHADTVRKTFVRDDGSVCHIVEFDPETGEFVRSYGGQGYAEGSAWSRGQGWGIYGFMISYLHTKKKEYLETAKRIADYVVDRLPENGIVPIDFVQPKEPAWEDSCGACIIANGLLTLAEEISKLEDLKIENSEIEKYEKAAVKILKAIAQTRANWGSDCDAIVQNCSAAYHNKDHHTTMVYADFYFLEAILKICEDDYFIW